MFTNFICHMSNLDARETFFSHTDDNGDATQSPGCSQEHPDLKKNIYI